MSAREDIAEKLVNMALKLPESATYIQLKKLLGEVVGASRILDANTPEAICGVPLENTHSCGTDEQNERSNNTATNTYTQNAGVVEKDVVVESDMTLRKNITANEQNPV